jgi:hypothetical protein
MQQITKLMREAFISGTPFRRDNTEVRVTDYSVSIYLFGNKIASRRIGLGLLADANNPIGPSSPYEFTITTCGWPTNTTKDRLNALPNVHIHQLKGMWYLNGEKWDGSNCVVCWK